MIYIALVKHIPVGRHVIVRPAETAGELVDLAGHGDRLHKVDLPDLWDSSTLLAKIDEQFIEGKFKEI